MYPNSQDIQARLDAEMEKARAAFKGLRSGSQEGKACFWKMAYRKGSSSTLAGGICARNFEFQDMEDSLSCLRESIKLFGPSQKPAAEFVLAIVTSEKSNNDNIIIISNPYYMGAPQIAGMHQNNMYGGYGGGMMGMGMQHQSTMMMIMELQKQNFENQMKAQEQRFEQMMALKEKEDEIAGLEESKKGGMEKMLDILDSEGVNNILDRLQLMVMSNKVPQQPQQQVQQQVPPPQPQQQPQQHTDVNNISEEEKQKYHKMNKGIKMLFEKYGDEISDLIYQMGLMCQENPTMADIVVNQLRNKQTQ